MSFEIRACTIADVHSHPTLKGRTQGKVNVTLRETLRGGKLHDHKLTLKVWADTDESMSLADVNSALLGRAAAILKRTMSVAEIPAALATAD